MEPFSLTLSTVRLHIRDRSEKWNRERGTPASWRGFIEEGVELSHALARGNDRANIEEEFADVLAWLCTLANINDVDLSTAVSKKYLSPSPPEGHK
jgi:NTP pyrophosphatase (non-canonical NTP hydrolase)